MLGCGLAVDTFIIVGAVVALLSQEMINWEISYIIYHCIIYGNIFHIIWQVPYELSLGKVNKTKPKEASEWHGEGAVKEMYSFGLEAEAG